MPIDLQIHLWWPGNLMKNTTKSKQSKKNISPKILNLKNSAPIFLTFWFEMLQKYKGFIQKNISFWGWMVSDYIWCNLPFCLKCLSVAWLSTTVPILCPNCRMVWKCPRVLKAYPLNTKEYITRVNGYFKFSPVMTQQVCISSEDRICKF